MDEQDATLRRRGELPRRSPDGELTGTKDGFIGAGEDGAAEPSLAGRLPATLAPPGLFGEEPTTAPGSPALDARDATEPSDGPAPATGKRPAHPPGGEIWISASDDEGEGEIGLEGPGDDEGVLPG